MVAARLERHVEGRTTGGLPGLPKGHDLGVGAAEAGMVADADEPAIADDDRADHRIGLDQAPTFLGFAEGEIHPGKVVSVHAGSVLVAELQNGKTKVANSSRRRVPGAVGWRGRGWPGPAPRLTG